MGFFNLFSGKTPEVIERSGDDYFTKREYGLAKLEYEKALNKAEKQGREKAEFAGRLREKIDRSREALAVFHMHTAESLVQAGSHADAKALLTLALELTREEALKEEIRLKLKEVEDGLEAEKRRPDEDRHKSPQKAEAQPPEAEAFKPALAGVMEEEPDADEYFSVLCSALPEEFQKAYQGYGQRFKEGYIALNRGEFEPAVKKLSESLAENPGSLIPLELATALVNQGKTDHAQRLMEGFVRQYPMLLRGYQILCDIYWEGKNYDAALKLFRSCPDELAQTLPIQLLTGETLYQAGRYEEAREIFSSCETRFGENEILSRALAKTYEALGSIAKARSLYGKLISGCAACGARRDPFLKRRYAELSYEAGEKPSKLLELYFSLVREDPDNRSEYYQRIVGIYESLGNNKEAQRYRSMIKGLDKSTE